MRRRAPVRRDVSQPQPDQLGGCFIVWEMTPGLDNLAQLGIDAFDGIDGVDYFRMAGGKTKKIITRTQARFQAATTVGYCLAQGPLSNSSSACSAASALMA